MSGYLFFRNVASIKDVFFKMKKRAITLIIPYLSWSALYYFFYVFGNRFLGIEMLNPPSVNLFDIVKGIAFFEYSFFLWYIFQLIIFTALTPLVFYALKYLKGYLWIFVPIALLLSLIGRGNYFAVTSLSRPLIQLNYMAYWIAGCLLAQLKNTDAILFFIKKIPVWAAAASLLAVSAVSSLIYDDVIPFGYSDRVLVPLVCFIYMVLLMRIFDDESGRTLFNNPPSSIVVYGIHSLVALFIGRALYALFAAIGMAPPLLPCYFIVLVLTSIISILIAVILKKIKPLYFLFAGNRK